MLAGARGKQVGIALLAPPFSPDRNYNDVRSRARLVASVIASTLGDEISGRIARYDDTFNPRAFGDLMQQWGTSTPLESARWPGDPEKQRGVDVSPRCWRLSTRCRAVTGTDPNADESPGPGTAADE